MSRKIKPRIPPQVNLPSLSSTTAKPADVNAPTTPVSDSQSLNYSEPELNNSEVIETPEESNEHDTSGYKVNQSLECVPEASEAKRFDDTYFFLNTEKNGSIELDLVSHRQRGIEKRYLNIKVNGFRLDKTENKPVECLMNIVSKENFQELKDFFSSLSWED